MSGTEAPKERKVYEAREGWKRNEEEAEQLTKSVCDYLVQAVCGMHMAVYRRFNLMPGEDSGNMKVGMFAHYLNNCFRSLIVEDDPFVVESFTKIFVQMPEESPVCFFHVLFALGKILLDRADEYQFPSSDPEVDALREMLMTGIEMQATDLVRKWVDELSGHSCTGIPFERICEEDPDQPFFTLRTETQGGEPVQPTD